MRSDDKFAYACPCFVDYNHCLIIDIIFVFVLTFQLWYFNILQERVLKCLELIKDLSLIKVAASLGTKSSAPFMPQSPIGVLDAGCLSSKSDELTVGSCPNSLHNSPNN